MFKVSERGLIGYQSVGGARRYCCSESLASEAGCTPGRPIVMPLADDPRRPWTRDIHFSGAREVAVARDAAVRIEHTGMYHLWFMTCDASLATTRVAGFTAWKNPNGFLPGMMAHNLPFFRAMSAAYVALSLGWLVACAAAWRHVLPLQHCISAVLLLGMAEMLTWSVDYDTFNETGFRPYGTTVLAVLFGAVRKTLSRMLLLVAAMGFGIVRPTLGEARARVLALGAAYFLATCGLDVTTHVGTIDDLSRGARVFLVAPVAGLDAGFILWTFTSLSATLALLSARRAAAPKLDLYRRFTNALAAAVVVSIAWIGYEVWFKVSDAHNAHWQSDWVTAAFWHILSFLLIAAMCATWLPGDAVAQFVRSAAEPVPGSPTSPCAAALEAGASGGGRGGAAAASPFTLGDEEEPRTSKTS